MGFVGHGKRDAYAAVSLDDGATWKRTNLSQSAALSSFNILEANRWVPYPGDVGRTFMGADGNQVLGSYVVDLDDEITRGTLITRDGSVVHEQVLEALRAEPQGGDS